MDGLDVRIIREMGIRPYLARPKDPDRLKPSYLARRVGASLNTVKKRIAAMEAQGVIAGYQVVPNLQHLGLAGSAYYFSGPKDEDKEQAIQAIAAMPGLLEIHDFLEHGFCIDFAHRGDVDQDTWIAKLSAITGDEAPVEFYKRDMPRVQRPLTHLDWRIVQALRSRPLRSLDEVGAELGVTGRTVRKRYGRMCSEGSCLSIPILDASKAGGVLLFGLMVYTHAGAFREAKQAILEQINDQHVFANVPSSPELGNLDVLVFATTMAEVEAIRAMAEAIPGVRRAHAWYFRGLHDHSDWMDDAIAEQVRATGARAEG